MSRSNLIIFISILGASCAAPDSPPVTICGVELGETPTQWTRWDEGPFIAYTPRKMFERSWGGIDSYGGSWTGLGASVGYDHGAYSAPLTEESFDYPSSTVSNYTLCTGTPRGSTRTAMWSSGGRDWVGTYWEDAGPSMWFGGEQRDHLQMSVMLSDLLPLRRALQILNSVELTERRGEWPGELGIFIDDTILPPRR